MAHGIVMQEVVVALKAQQCVGQAGCAWPLLQARW